MNKYKELITKARTTFLLLLIALLGLNIPLPGYGLAEAASSVTHNQVLQFLQTATGGNFTTPVLFSLGIGPFMIATILWSVFQMAEIDVINALTDRQKGYIQNLVCLFFSLLQSISLVYNFQSSLKSNSYSQTISISTFLYEVAILTCGGMAITWIANYNMKYGVGSSIIFILPGMFLSLPKTFLVPAYSPLVTNQLYFSLLIFATFLIMLITTYIYNAEYRIDIQRIGLDPEYNNSYFAIRLLIAGPMPLMFSMSILYIPQLLISALGISNPQVIGFITLWFTTSTLQGIVVYSLILYLLGIAFCFMNIRPHSLAKDLKKSGDYILGINPGKETEAYIKKRVRVISLIGSLYLVILVIIPLLLGLKYPIFAGLSNYFALVYVFVVIMDMVGRDVEFIYYKNNYDIFSKRNRRGAV